MLSIPHSTEELARKVWAHFPYLDPQKRRSLADIAARVAGGSDTDEDREALRDLLRGWNLDGDWPDDDLRKAALAYGHQGLSPQPVVPMNPPWRRPQQVIDPEVLSDRAHEDKVRRLEAPTLDRQYCPEIKRNNRDTESACTCI